MSTSNTDSWEINKIYPTKVVAIEIVDMVKNESGFSVYKVIIKDDLANETVAYIGEHVIGTKINIDLFDYTSNNITIDDVFWIKLHLQTRDMFTLNNPEIILEKIKSIEDDAIKRTRLVTQKAKQAKVVRESRGGVKIGMNKLQVSSSNWGKPDKVNKTITIYGIQEQWIYGQENYL
ncbi:MAG: hypothetical protein QX196_15560 [Methylococcaceae bacterium]